jgi:transposase
MSVEHGWMRIKRRGVYPSDVTDEEWAFVVPYLLLCREDSPRRKHDLCLVFNAVRYVARTGGQWRYLPNDLPPWFVVYQQMQRWLQAGGFEMLVEAEFKLLPAARSYRQNRRCSTPVANAGGTSMAASRSPAFKDRHF